MTDPEKPDPAELFLGLKRSTIETDKDTLQEQIAWATRLAPLDDSIEDPLPPHLWSGIEKKLNQQDAFPGFKTITASEGNWEPLSAGIARKIVHMNSELDTLCYFLKLDEGAVLPEHEHLGEEHCVVLQGELRLGDLTFGEGSYQLAQSDTHHPPVVAVSPALIYIQSSF